MRRIAYLSVLSLLAMPVAALAQTASFPPPGQPGMQPPPDQAGMQPPPPGAPEAPPQPDMAGRNDKAGGMMRKWQNKFDAANTTHDGHLTLPQAQAARMKPIVDHFAEIDTKNRGYLTFNDIMAWHLDQQARKMEQRAAALRAQD
jgi:hypothetical protein